MTDPITGEIFHFHTLTLSSKANQEDYPTLKEILKMPMADQKEWYDAMHKEMEGLLQKECYELVDRASVEADGHQIVPTTWAL